MKILKRIFEGKLIEESITCCAECDYLWDDDLGYEDSNWLEPYYCMNEENKTDDDHIDNDLYDTGFPDFCPLEDAE